MKFSVASKTKKNIVALIYGDTFTGKTTIASQFAYFKRPDGKPFRVIIVDAETTGTGYAIEDLIDNGVDPRNVLVTYCQSVKEFGEIVTRIKEKTPFYIPDDDGEETDEVLLDADGEPFYPDAIVIDGTSILRLTTERGLVEFSKKRNALKADKKNIVGAEKNIIVQGSGLELKDYQTIKFTGQNLVLDLMSMDIHVILTAREKDATINVKDENGEIKTVNNGKTFDSFKDIDYNANQVFRTFVDETGAYCMEIIKDRSKIHLKGEILENPSLLDWQEVVDKNVGKKTFVLNNDLNNAIENEAKIFENEAANIMTDKSAPKEETSDVESVDEIKAKIRAIGSSLNPMANAEAKKAVKEAGLNPNVSKVTDVDYLKKVLSILEKFA